MRTPIFLMALAAACVDPDVGRDRDNDGFQNWELGGDDCDDTNAAVNPSASEACGNGIDDDCDGFIDDEGIGQVVWYIDQDEDGFPSPEPYEGCSPPDGSFADLTRGVDCNDDEARSFPGNPETYYDGIDGDCLEGNDFDADGDGYTSAEHGGDDCDDNALDVNPGSVEVCNNGVDDDCDGGPGPCEYRGQYALGEIGHQTLPVRMWDAVSADIDGDGLDEALLLDAPEDDFDVWRLRVYSMAEETDQYELTQTLPVPSVDVGLYARINAVGDYDDDGNVDPLVWSESGVVFWTGADFATNTAVIDGAGELTWVSVLSRANEPDRVVVFMEKNGLVAGSGNAMHTFAPWTGELELSDDRTWLGTWPVSGGLDRLSQPGEAAFVVVSDPSTFSDFSTHYQWIWDLDGTAFPRTTGLLQNTLPLDANLLFRTDVTRVSPGVFRLQTWERLPALVREGGGFAMEMDTTDSTPVFRTLPTFLPLVPEDESQAAPTFIQRQRCDLNQDGIEDIVQIAGAADGILSFDGTEVSVLYGDGEQGYVPDVTVSFGPVEADTTIRCSDRSGGQLWIGHAGSTYRVPMLSP